MTMRIYLACTVRGERAGVEVAREIAGRLVNYGHEVLTSHLLADGVEKAEAKLTEREVYERDLRWLDSCDVLIAEASGSSYGVGFEVGYVTARAPTSGQQVIVMYDAARAPFISRMITGYQSKGSIVLAYRGNVEAVALIDAQFAGSLTWR
jgi:nucleoside 2-deoxyribosyltransferase